MQRRAVYEAAKGRRPERWGSRPMRAWTAPQQVLLNPTPDTRLEARAALQGAA